jgi:hypothetical protein
LDNGPNFECRGRARLATVTVQLDPEDLQVVSLLEHEEK